MGPLAVAILLATMLACAAMLSGCGNAASSSAASATASPAASSASAAATSANASSAASSASSRQTYDTLEAYFNTAEGKEKISGIVSTDSLSQFGSVEYAVEGNTLTLTVTINQQFENSPIGKDSFSPETIEAMREGIAQLEQGIGVSNVELSLVFKDASGKQLFSANFNDEGIV